MGANLKRNYREIIERAKADIMNGYVKPSFVYLARHFDVPRTTLEGAFMREGILTETLRAWAVGEVDDGPPTPSSYDTEAILEFNNVKKSDKDDWRKIIQVAQDVQELDESYSDVSRISDVRINVDSPAVAIQFSSDWHLGDMATNHEQWSRDMRYILDTPELFMIDMGDDRQNMRNFRNLGSVLGQAISPKLQARMLRGVVNELTEKEKLLAKVDGNHDVEFDERIFGESLQAYLLERMKAPRFRNRGILRVHFGDQLYYILMFHKSRFRSFLRGAHGNFREYQLSAPADIVAGGHDHSPALEWISHYTFAKQAGMDIGGGAWLIKTGTYQDSDFGFKYFHNGGYQMCFTAVLWRDQKYIQVMNDPRHAISLIRSLK